MAGQKGTVTCEERFGFRASECLQWSGLRSSGADAFLKSGGGQRVTPKIESAMPPKKVADVTSGRTLGTERYSYYVV